MSGRSEPGVALRLVAIALSSYVVWVASTYFLEGRIGLFLTVDTVGRITYVAIANILVGTVLSVLAILYLSKRRFIRPDQIGLGKSRARTALMMAGASAGGFGLFILSSRSAEPFDVFNVFMQVLPVSIAEVMVC